MGENTTKQQTHPSNHLQNSKNLLFYFLLCTCHEIFMKPLKNFVIFAKTISYCFSISQNLLNLLQKTKNSIKLFVIAVFIVEILKIV